MPADKSYLYGLGDKLRILREAKHLKQSQVAKYLGISTTAVSEYESEIKTPSLEVFARLVAFYDISADYLIGISKDNLLKVLFFYAFRPTTEPLPFSRFCIILNPGVAQ